jgi:alpha-beta hydrolase superfamily lysophospholipase
MSSETGTAPVTTSATRISVTDRTGLAGEQEIATWSFAPADPSTTRAVLQCAHGGTYSHAYWHFTLPGHPGYDFAEFMVARGYAVIVTDELGTGQSTVPDDIWSLTSVDVAAAQHAVADTVIGELGLRDLPVVGVGHSLGGMITLRQQGAHRTFDALAILGWTNHGPRLSDAWVQARARLAARILDFVGDTPRTEVEEMVGRSHPDWLTGLADVPDWGAGRRALYYHDEVPEAVMAADEALLGGRPGSIAFSGMVDDIVAAESAAIDVPIFLGFGERDVSGDPWIEPASYTSSHDVTLHVLPRAGHCHNFAPTRADQWARIARWIDDVVIGD